MYVYITLSSIIHPFLILSLIAETKVPGILINFTKRLCSLRMPQFVIAFRTLLIGCGFLCIYGESEQATIGLGYIDAAVQENIKHPNYRFIRLMVQLFRNVTSKSEEADKNDDSRYRRSPKGGLPPDHLPHSLARWTTGGEERSFD